MRLAGALLLALAAACSGDGVDRTVAVESYDFAYRGLEPFTGTTGEKVAFRLTNAGPARHEFVVIDPGGTVIGGVPPVDAAKSGRVRLTLKSPGTYTFACFVDDHLWRDMKGTFEVR